MTRRVQVTHIDIAAHTARGRRLQAAAVRSGFATAYRWILAAATGVVTRRSFTRHGSSCGAAA